MESKLPDRDVVLIKQSTNNVQNKNKGAVGKYWILIPAERNRNILTNTRRFGFGTLSGYFTFL